MDKTTTWITGIIVLVALGGGIYLINRAPNPNEAGTNTNDTNTENGDQEVVSTGRVIFSVTDAAANMGLISDINIKINSVEVHHATRGWLTVSTTPRTFSLLMLKKNNISELLADVSIKADNYDQVRFVIDSVSVITKDGKTAGALLPSKQMVINTALTLSPNLISSVNFDFLADKSLHTTTKGEYVFAPVVKTEVRSDTKITIDSQNVVSITGGVVVDGNTTGMDIDGSLKLNFMISSTKKLSIDGSNIINAGTLLSK